MKSIISLVDRNIDEHPKDFRIGDLIAEPCRSDVWQYLITEVKENTVRVRVFDGTSGEEHFFLYAEEEGLWINLPWPEAILIAVNQTI
jgi:hypothetical protein